MISFDKDAQNLLHDIGTRIAQAICAKGSPGKDAAGGHVDSVTEAVMGVTAGLVLIAEAIDNLADATRGN